MKKKLTLSLDDARIRRAKAYAKERGKSVSQLVSEYFDALTREEEDAPSAGRPGRDRPLPDAVEDLIGIAEGDKDDYYQHLEEKHR